MGLRQTGGSVVCRSCNLLVGVNEAACYHCGTPYPGLWGFGPSLRRLGSDLGFTNIVMVTCGVLYLVALALDPGAIGGGGLFGLLSPSNSASYLLGASGSIPVFQLGRWWTVLSAGWLHGSLLHIAFNMMWVRQLAPVTAEIYGPGRTILIYTASSVVGFSLSSLAGLFFGGIPFIGGASFTVGASAAIFGLLGALVYSGRRGVASQISRQAQTYAVILFLFGLVMPRIDNWAHLGGFGGGFAIAAFLNPLLPERLNHLAAAGVCLVLTTGAIVLSFVTGAGHV
jgi:rhomboid protease GluP